MLRAYKTEIHPTKDQIMKINQSLGICRFLYNKYIRENITAHQGKMPFITANAFDKYVNHELKKELTWINNCSAKARKQAVKRAETAFKNFFSNGKGFPRFKKKRNNNMSFYFVKNNKTDCLAQRHRIKIPTLKWVRLKEKAYIPVNAKIISGVITKDAGRYYVSIVIDVNHNIACSNATESIGIGIDLGIKEFAVCSDKTVYPNINKTRRIKKLEKQLRQKQRQLSRKLLKHKKGGTTRNIDKQQLKVQKLHQTLRNKRHDYINKIINDIIKRKPSFITIENLNISGMMKNKHLSNAIAKQCFYLFKRKLYDKCKINNIELRIADRFYPSSKTCSKCGLINKNLKLKDRMFSCSCGLHIDRDLNASINLMNTVSYTTA
jgi:transposase, IS605 orfB family